MIKACINFSTKAVPIPLVLLELSVVATGDAKLVGDQEVPVPG